MNSLLASLASVRSSAANALRKKAVKSARPSVAAVDPAIPIARPRTAYQMFTRGDTHHGIKGVADAYPVQYKEWKNAHPNVKQGSLLKFAKEAVEGFAAKDYTALKARFPPPSAESRYAESVAAAANDPAEEAMRIANTIQEELEHLKSALGRLHGGTRKRRSLR